MPVAIITGASKGLGRVLALELARDEWSLVIDGRDGDALAIARRGLDAVGATVTALAGDVADATHRESLVSAAEALGSLDLLVNNASTLGPSPLPSLGEMPLDEFRHVFEVNVVAPFALIQLALPLLRAAKGIVIGVSSDAAREPYEHWGGYGSSKAALDQLHHVLAAEESDLRVYAVDPGDMRTEMHQAAFPGEDISDRPEPETVAPSLLRLIGSRSPSGRYLAREWAA
jgi:NAD(P)-dependent dehydrogenase (short-subunit alcohol dehydrogenase family)